MILADFKLRPLKGSKFHTRIRIFDTQRNMERQAVADGEMTGRAKACFGGKERDEIGPDNCVGFVYLFYRDNHTLRLDAVHELTHAAVHYARVIRGGDLSEHHAYQCASRAEEVLCESMESYLGDFFTELARFLSRETFTTAA